MTYDVEIDGRTLSVSVREHPEGGYLIRVGDGPERHIDAKRFGAAEWWLREGAAEHRIGAYVRGDRVALQLAGHCVLGTITDPRDAALHRASGGGEGAVSTPMPGLVVRVPAVVGQAVHKGQVLVVVEAMKMENEYKSPIDGVVAAVHAQAGQAVEAGALLITVEPA